MGSIAFDRIADRYDETRGGTARGVAFVPTLQPLLRGERVVEVGVGTGIVAAALRDAGVPVVGFDLSGPMVERAHARLGSRVALADAHDLPVADRSVDTLLFVWVLHLVGDVTDVLRECRRALRPHGRVVACVGGRQDVADEMSAIVEPINRLRRGDDRPEVIEAAAERAGLRVVARETTPDLPYSSSPAVEADRIEARTSSAVWDLDDETWQRVVVPVVEQLRSLPEPERQRRRVARYAMLAFEVA